MNTPIRQIDVSAYTVPTESPESDGTLIWDSTALVLVQAHAGGKVGIGYTYAAPAARYRWPSRARQPAQDWASNSKTPTPNLTQFKIEPGVRSE